MKKRKITYSLTAQQKKKLKRQQELGEEAKVEEKPEVSPEKKKKVALIVSISAVVMAAALIFLAIFIPIWTSNEVVTQATFLNWKNFNPNDPDNPYTDENPNPNPTPNPIVTVTLTGDDKEAFKQVFGAEKVAISIEVFMDDAPYAGMNFMYLAESGFYDGTIISDVNRGHAMFSGFTKAENNANRAREASFIRNLKGFVSNTISTWDAKNYKLGYRLKAETKRSAMNSSQGSLGYLIMMAGSSTNYSTSTSFMFITREDPQLNFGDDNTSTSSYMSWLGRVTNEQSMQVLRKLDGVETELSGKMYAPKTLIKIESVKTNLSKERKNYLLKNFEELISGGTASTTWRNNAYNAEYYKFAK